MTSRTERDVMSLVQRHILDLDYKAIEPIDVLAARLGVPESEIVKLDGNENPYGPSPRVLEALGSFDQYHRYADPQQRHLRTALGDYAGVGVENVVAGHGGDELIDLLVRMTIGPGDVVIDSSPTFGMYDFSTRVQGGRIVDVPRRRDFTVEVAGIEERVRSYGDRAKIVFVASPNNPTGNLLTEAELSGLLDTGLLVVVDEAYAEFSGQSYASEVSSHENLVVLRTFSKWAGLAGLRAGYGILPAALAGVLMRMKPPFTPNVAAEVAMLASLEDKDYLLTRVDEIVRERERLVKQLQTLEFAEPYPSEANFVLVRIPSADGRALRDNLASRGVFLRFFDQPMLQDCIRISVGRSGDTDRVVEALREQGGRVGR